jgi:hypothetical protein
VGPSAMSPPFCGSSKRLRNMADDDDEGEVDERLPKRRFAAGGIQLWAVEVSEFQQYFRKSSRSLMFFSIFLVCLLNFQNLQLLSRGSLGIYTTVGPSNLAIGWAGGSR